MIEAAHSLDHTPLASSPKLKKERAIRAAIAANRDTFFHILEVQRVRDQSVIWAHLMEKPYREIGQEFHLTGARCHQIWQEFVRKFERAISHAVIF